jgi:hypothetical protein
MTVIETKSSGLRRVVGGIAGAALAGLLIFYLMRPSSQKDAIAPTEFDGFEADSTSRALLRDAEINVTLGSYSAHQKTDTFGRYSISFPSPQADASVATVEIRATNYGDYKNTIALRPGSNYAEIMLNPASHAATSEAAPGDGDTNSSLPKPVVAKAQVFVKSLPPDFLKANTVYVATSKK